MRAAMGELIVFGIKEARACVFPVLFFAILGLSTQIPLVGLARYDGIFLATCLVQLGLLLTGIETLHEMLVLGIFHGLGLILEVFKTHPAIGSWSYPEPGFFKLGAVPLYSGFMYAAVASYLCQAWRILQLSVQNDPSPWLTMPLCTAIYLNFFTHHVMIDLRWWLMAAALLVFGRARIVFHVTDRTRWMPVPVAFGLIGFFIWLAEQVATYFGAWRYPDQLADWAPVALGKWGSWSLLVIVSFVIVARLKHDSALRHSASSRRTVTSDNSRW